MKKIVIFAMATWGELGNLLAAEVLAGSLRHLADVEVKVVQIESLVPRFAEIGRGIKALVSEGQSPASTSNSYLNYMTSLEPEFSEAETLTNDTSRLLALVRPVVAFLKQEDASLLVGTKGIISRIVSAASRLAECHVPLINYVTNEGLLTLPIHRSPQLAHTFVPFSSGKEYLVERCGYKVDRVKVVGRLIPCPAPKDQSLKSGEAAEATPRILVFSNRGGVKYLRLLEFLLNSAHRIEVVFVTYNDAGLAKRARELIMERSPIGWDVVDQLTQSSYIELVRWLAQSSAPLLITKTGPNTMLEAAYNGVPQLLLNSGLPMEQWVPSFVETHRFGRGFDSMDDLIDSLDRLLENPGEIGRLKMSALEFSLAILDQDSANARIQAAFGGLLHHSSGEGQQITT